MYVHMELLQQNYLLLNNLIRRFKIITIFDFLILQIWTTASWLWTDT